MPSLRSRKAPSTSTNVTQPRQPQPSTKPKPPRKQKSRPQKRRRGNTDQTDEAANSTDSERSHPHSNAVDDSPQLDQLPGDATTLSSEDDDLPTLQNYDKDHIMKLWPPSRCKQRLSLGFKARASTDGQNEIRALIKKYQHMKMLIALALKTSLRTVNKITKASTKKQESAYLNYRVFARREQMETMPHPDNPDISPKLASYNQAIGDAWSGLNADQRAIFEHSLLLALAGVPDLAADHVESEEEDQDERGDCEVPVPEVTQLTEDEETRYRPIYEALVDHEKVVAKFGSVDSGISDAKFTRRSLRCIQKHQRDLIADSYRHEFDFWLIASSSVPPLQAGTLTWCKVTTTLPIMTKWVTQKANFPTIFGAVSQGTSLIQAVSKETGSNVIKSQPRKNQSDREKVELGQLLVGLLTAATPGK